MFSNTVSNLSSIVRRSFKTKKSFEDVNDLPIDAEVTRFVVLGTIDYVRHKRFNGLFENRTLPPDLFDFYYSHNSSGKKVSSSVYMYTVDDEFVSNDLTYLRALKPAMFVFIVRLPKNLAEQLQKLESVIGNLPSPLATLPRFVVAFSLDKQKYEINQFYEFCEQCDFRVLRI